MSNKDNLNSIIKIYKFINTKQIIRFFRPIHGHIIFQWKYKLTSSIVKTERDLMMVLFKIKTSHHDIVRSNIYSI